MELAGLLMYSVRQIKNLEKYYDTQFESLMDEKEKILKEYKYGIALNKFFLQQLKEYEGGEPDEDFLGEEDMKLVDEVLESHTIDYIDGEPRILFKLKDLGDLERDYVVSPVSAMQVVLENSEHIDILCESTLMMLLVRYEEAISKIFEGLIECYPNAYLKEKTITFSEFVELSATNTMAEIKKKYIDREVEELMRMSVSEWYRIFETRHSAKFSFENDEFNDFLEIYYRRNVVVHNNGRVNDTYNAFTKAELEVGDRLVTNRDYIKKSIKGVLIILYGTFWGLKKTCSDKKDVDAVLFDIGFGNMIDRNWNASEYIFNLLLNSKDSTASSKISAKVNYWISQKNRYGLDSIRKEVDEFDTSALDDVFKVAKLALVDDFPKVSEGLERILGKEFPVDYIENWPLFLQYRTSEEYVVFKEMHKEVFEVQDYQPNINDADDIETAKERVET